jgi:hypothetical protein
MRLLLFLAAAVTAFAQPDTGTITITASRNVTAVPDQLLYSVTLRTELALEVSEVVARLAGTGIRPADLTYVNGTGEFVDWTCSLATPFSKMAEMNAALAALQQRIGKGFLPPPLSFRVTAPQTSADAQAQSCSLAALVSDARREADGIASAAGVHVGKIVGLSESPAMPTLVGRLGSFSQIVPVVYDPTVLPASIGYASFLLGQRFQPYPIYNTPCSLVVQFGLVP